jgi:hypothetical protein
VRTVPRSRRSITAARLAVLVLAGGLGATACGGGGARLSEQQYRKQADAQCAKLAAASEELGLAQQEGAVGAAVRGYVRAAAEGLRDLTDGLGSLRPPESLESDADDLLAALDEYADGLDDIASRVERGQGLTAALDAAPKLVARLNRISDRATKLVVALGLDACQISG